MAGDRKQFSWESALGELNERRRRKLTLGGPERIEREHRLGRLTARERLEAILDPDSFREVGSLAMSRRRDPDSETEEVTPSSTVCGLGRIDGRPVAIGADDYTVRQGLPTFYLHRLKGGLGGFVEELAMKYRIPLVMLLEGVGGDVATHEYREYAEVSGADPTYPMFDLLSEVPVATAVLGPSAGASAFRAVISHFSVMTAKNSYAFAGGPKLVKQGLGVEIDKFALGGADVHTKVSGMIDNAAGDELDAFRQIKRFLSFLPRSVHELPPVVPSEDPPDRSCDELLSLIPENRRRAYNMRAVIRSIADRDSFFEIAPAFGGALIVGLARLHGRTVGILAGNPYVNGGAIDGAAADKQARFVDMCDTFHVPLVYLADTAGVMIGHAAEASGTMRRVARAVMSLHRATVPLVTVVVGKVYGVAGLATINVHNLGLKLAWPTAVWSGLPTESGVEVLYGRRIARSEEPEKLRRELEQKVSDFISPWRTAEAFAVEEIIDPRETRGRLIEFLDVAATGMTPGPKLRPIGRP